MSKCLSWTCTCWKWCHFRLLRSVMCSWLSELPYARSWEKKRGGGGCQGYQGWQSNTPWSPAASQQDQPQQRSLKQALRSLPLLVIAPLSALHSGRMVSSPTHSRSVTLCSTPCCVSCVFVRQMRAHFACFSPASQGEKKTQFAFVHVRVITL